MPNHNAKWTPEEDAIRRRMKHVEHKTSDEISKALPGRTAQACRRQYLEHDYKYVFKVWTAEKLQNIPLHGWNPEQICKFSELVIEGRSAQQIAEYFQRSNEWPSKSTASCLHMRQYLEEEDAKVEFGGKGVDIDTASASPQATEAVVEEVSESRPSLPPLNEIFPTGIPMAGVVDQSLMSKLTLPPLQNAAAWQSTDNTSPESQGQTRQPPEPSARQSSSHSPK